VVKGGGDEKVVGWGRKKRRIFDLIWIVIDKGSFEKIPSFSLKKVVQEPYGMRVLMTLFSFIATFQTSSAN
jgi:hypothetical protein